jgi:hypothetical protein
VGDVVEHFIGREMMNPLPDRFGRASRIRSATPAAHQRDHKMRRCGVRSTPTRSARRKKTVECLFSMPRPASNPKTSHARGLALPSAMRSRTNIDPIQKHGSKEFMEKEI